jgi:hypothetical protein
MRKRKRTFIQFTDYLLDHDESKQITLFVTRIKEITRTRRQSCIVKIGLRKLADKSGFTIERARNGFYYTLH